MNKENNNQLTNSKFGKWGWSIILYAFLLYYFNTGLSADAMNVIPDAYAGTYGLDRNLLLSFATPAGIVGVIGGIICGRICMKTGAKKLAAAALIITGVVFAVFGSCKTPVTFLIALSAINFTVNAFGLIATATLMSNWFPKKKGIALGWATMGAPLCSATFPALLSSLFGSKLGLSGSTVIVGAVIIILGVATFFWVHDYPEEVGAYPDNIPEDREVLSAQLDDLKNYRSPFTVGKLLKDKDMWCIALSFGLMWLVTGGIMSQFVPRMISVGYSQQTALLMLTIAAIIGLIGSYFWGWLDQKIGTKPASCVYAGSYIGALILMVFAQVHIFNYIALVFVGLGIGGLLNLMPSLVAAVYGRYDFMAANGLLSPIAALVQKGAFALTAILLAKSGGDFTLPYTVFIGIDILGIILLLCVTKECKGKQD